MTQAVAVVSVVAAAVVAVSVVVDSVVVSGPVVSGAETVVAEYQNLLEEVNSKFSLLIRTNAINFVK